MNDELEKYVNKTNKEYNKITLSLNALTIATLLGTGAAGFNLVHSSGPIGILYGIGVYEFGMMSATGIFMNYGMNKMKKDEIKELKKCK